jgi:hypothetical protein
MKLLFICNLFLICSNAFILTPSNPSLIKSNILLTNPSISINNNNLILYKHSSLINMNLKKKKNKSNDNDDRYKEDVTVLTVNIIYNVILYSYIYYLLTTFKHLN